MYEHLYNGRFGNYPLAWESLQEVLESSYRGHISLRSRQTSNPIRLYHIPFSDLNTTLAKLPIEQTKYGLVFSESPDDSKRTIQGEWDGFSLTYSFYKAPMRLAFEKQMLHAEGAKARWLLKSYLDVSDYEWLGELIEDFPNHIVEFSGFSCRVGVLRRYAVFWECRLY